MTAARRLQILAGGLVLAPFTVGAVVVLRWAAEMFPPELNEIEEGLAPNFP